MKLTDQRIRYLVTGLGGFYLVFLLSVVGTTAFKYRDYYAPPAIDQTLGEDAVLDVWNLKYEARYKEYRHSVRAIGLSLAVFLAIGAGALGVWKNSFSKGLIALGAGGLVTVLALSILPLVYFPFDSYSVAAVWLFGASPWIILTWAVLTIFGLTLRKFAPQGILSDL
jgi:hypothetical protein